MSNKEPVKNDLSNTPIGRVSEVYQTNCNTWGASDAEVTLICLSLLKEKDEETAIKILESDAHAAALEKVSSEPSLPDMAEKLFVSTIIGFLNNYGFFYLSDVDSDDKQRMNPK